MKRFTSILSVALLCFGMAAAHGTESGQGGDSVLISKSQQQDKVIEHYLVKSDNVESADYQAHFPLNVSTLQQNFGGNALQMKALSEFVTKSADTLMHIKSVVIVGTASPDGVPSNNAALATSRAQTMKNCVAKKFPDAKITLTSKVYTWAECADAVKSSNLTNKGAVAAILNSKDHTEQQKEALLQKHPEAWNYLKTTVLPPLRKAEVDFDYTVDKIVEKVIVVAVPKPTQTTQPKPVHNTTVEQKPKSGTEKKYPVAVVETSETGIIVEVPPKEHKHHKREKKNR